MTGLGNYDEWKCREPDYDAEVCDHCGGYLRRAWPHGWCCDRCDEETAYLEWELEYRQQQLDEQAP